jgi:hypothetical protein
VAGTDALRPALAGLLAQAVRAVGDHDAGDAEALDGLEAPEVETARERGLLFEGEVGNVGH